MKENREILGTQGQSGRFTENANTIACKIAIQALEKQIEQKGGNAWHQNLNGEDTL